MIQKGFAMSVDWRETEALTSGLHLTVELEDGVVYSVLRYGEVVLPIEGEIGFDGVSFETRDVGITWPNGGWANPRMASPRDIESLGGLQRAVSARFY